MNIIVSLKTKEILFNKGWRYELCSDKTGHRVQHSLAEQKWNEGDLTYVDITIGEVVMWLYEKYEVWISPTPFYIILGKRFSADIFTKDNQKISVGHNENPIKAYEHAILYTLKNLI